MFNISENNADPVRPPRQGWLKKWLMTLTINHLLIDHLLGICEGSLAVFKYLNYFFGYVRNIIVFIQIINRLNSVKCRYFFSFLGGQDFSWVASFHRFSSDLAADQGEIVHLWWISSLGDWVWGLVFCSIFLKHNREKIRKL